MRSNHKLGAVALGVCVLLASPSASRACVDAASGALSGIVKSHCCGELDCGPSSSGGTLSSGSGMFDVSVVDNAFLPSQPIIKPMTTVRWTNNSPFFPHTTTRTGTWDSGFLNSGQFFDFTFDASRAGLAYDYFCSIHFGMDGTIQVTHFGDANLDGQVDLQDFNILAANFGQSGRTWETGDFTGDGTVNLNDFNQLAANFGKSIQPAISLDLSSGSFIPEPAAAALLPLLLLTLRRKPAR